MLECELCRRLFVAVQHWSGMHTCTHARTHTHTHTHTHTCTHTHTHTHTHTKKNKHTNTHTHACTHAHARTHTHARRPAHTHARTHTDTQTHTGHTHTHTHTHTNQERLFNGFSWPYKRLLWKALQTSLPLVWLGTPHRTGDRKHELHWKSLHLGKGKKVQSLFKN